MSQGNTIPVCIVSSPQALSRAFLDAEGMAKWLPPYGFTCKVHHLEAKVGGAFRMSFSNFGGGGGPLFRGEVPGDGAQRAGPLHR